MGNDMFNDEQLAHAKTTSESDRACETPLLDLLRRVPLDARAEYEHGRFSHSMIPYGSLCNRAADENERLRLALAEATRERDNWIETARTYAEGEDYYRSLIDKALKDEPSAYVADDGSISEDVLRAKLPEMYALAVSERKRAEAEFDRLRQDRHDALNAQTTEGWSAAEWQLRTGEAERERDEARGQRDAAKQRLCDTLDQLAALSRARETDGAVREAAEIVRKRLDNTVWALEYDEHAPGLVSDVEDLLRALSSPPRPAVLPLEAPECNDGDDCCRYCGRGLQPCGACKPAAPPADAATEAVREAKERLWDALDRESLGGTYLAARGLRAALSPAPAPSAKETCGHDWVRRGEGSCGNRYVCLRCGEQKP